MSSPEALTLDRALQILKKNDIPERFYLVGGLGNGECIGVAHHEEGVWLTYFSERGARTDVYTFDNEASACLDFLRRVREVVQSYGLDVVV